jgi:hypothetical protein
MIIFRRRKFLEHKFYEVLAVPNNGKLSLPEVLPERYGIRALNVNEYNGIRCIEVQSSPSERIDEMNLDNILNGQGIWITNNDTLPKGGIQEIKPKAQFFSVEFDDFIIQTLFTCDSFLKNLLQNMVGKIINLKLLNT